MVTSHENMEMKMGGLGTASSLTSDAFDVRRESSDLHAHAVQGNGGATTRKTHMKKLMIAVTAALCAAVGYSDGIESSNIVGYQNKGVDFGLSNQINTFEKVGSEGSNITEFTPVDGNGDKLSGKITVQFYNNVGKLQEGYTWWLGEDIDEGYVDGWYDNDMEEEKQRPLDFGEGFKVTTTYTGAKLVYSGQVDVGEVAVPIPFGLSSKGNVRPCGIKMSDIKIVDENDDPLSGKVTIQFYNEVGKLQEGYTWWLGEDIDEGYVDGWYDNDMEEVKDRDLVAGQGFCITTTYTGAFLKFPAIGSK